MQDYLDAKLRVMRVSDVSIVNAQVLEKAKELGVKVDFGDSKVRIFKKTGDTQENTIKITSENTLKAKASKAPNSAPLRDWTDGENIAISGRKKYKLSETKFTGPHNAMNFLATALVGNTLKICSKRTKVYFGEIDGLSHRFESIGAYHGIEYIDDSKATSAQAL